MLDRIRALVPASLRKKLRALHRDRVLYSTLRRIKEHDQYIPLSDQTIARLLYGWGNGWSLREEMITEMWHRAWHTRGPVLECGSGLSTLLLGIAADRVGYDLYSLEHDTRWHAQVAAAVQRLGLKRAKVIAAPLVMHGGYAWYDAPGDFPDEFTLVLCDGPPGSTMGGRYGLLPELRPALAADCVILLDDAAREGEQETLRRWAIEHHAVHRLFGDAKPFAVVEISGNR